ncbi:MAG: ArnT family glycosyltransferase [Elusimicrobiota bacterium]
MAKIPPLLRVWLLAVALGLPFIGRAYFVDDHYHLLMARGLLESPLRPYDFLADDAGPDNVGWERGQPPRMVNPPLHHYFLGVLWKAGGGRLWFVRLGNLMFAALGAVFIYLLARRFYLPPGPVTVLAVLSPAFWLSSHALLIDTTLLVFFLAALWLWIEGLEKNSRPALAGAGVLVGLAILTKYTGGFVGILCGLWWLLQPRERRRWTDLLFLAIPALMLGLWSWWNVAGYGAPHILAAAKRTGNSLRWGHVLVFLTFFGGVFLFPLASWFWGRRLNRRLFWTTALISAGLALVLAGPRGGFSPGQAVLMAALAGGALLFLAQLPREGLRIQPADGFLAAWLFLGTAQMMFVMGWVAARYYLTLLPPAVFLFYRVAQKIYRHAPSGLNRFQTAVGAVLFLFSLGLAWADYAQAETSRRIVEDTRRDGLPESPSADPGGPRRCFYLGDSFTGSYLKYAGWLPAFEDTDLRPGDLLLSQEVTMPRWWFRAMPRRFRPVKSYSYESRWPLRVMDNHGAAGFYASAWGPLPFTFSRSPLERYWLLEVTADNAADLREK